MSLISRIWLNKIFFLWVLYLLKSLYPAIQFQGSQGSLQQQKSDVKLAKKSHLTNLCSNRRADKSKIREIIQMQHRTFHEIISFLNLLSALSPAALNFHSPLVAIFDNGTTQDGLLISAFPPTAC